MGSGEMGVEKSGGGGIYGWGGLTWGFELRRSVWGMDGVSILAWLGSVLAFAGGCLFGT